MPKHFQQPVANYKNVDEFQHAAIQTMISLWGKHRKFTDFDFGEKSVEVSHGKHERFYFCVGYQTGEKVPAEASPGKALTPAQAEREAALAKQQKIVEDVGAGLVSATDFATDFAVKNKINLVEVAKTLPPGTKIGKNQVVDYLKANPPAPEKDTANEQNTKTENTIN
jgi:hypothetical protein